MNKDFWERLNKLEELAGKATQGEWSFTCDISGKFYLCCDTLADYECGIANFEYYPNVERDAEYIAAANPAMILEMIAELKRLEKEADYLAEKCACQNIMNGCQCGIDKNYRRNEARKSVMEADNA